MAQNEMSDWNWTELQDYMMNILDNQSLILSTQAKLLARLEERYKEVKE